MISLALTIYAVGKLKDSTISLKCEEYIKKICHDSRLGVVEVKDSEKIKEGEKIVSLIHKNQDYIIALSENGKEYSSIAFAQHIAKINKPISFIIGGHHGLDELVLNAATEQLSLSRMTFTHELARLFLLEQIYRALAILNNRSYHR
jgi:23S rRNA (pseudouridine1915-N3)-methyltransferase